jgi:hypothetical protein
MSEREASKMLWPTYALRAWLSALLDATERARDAVDTQTEYHEKEIARLRAQKERSGPVIASLREAIQAVDGVLRRVRDTDPPKESERPEARERHEKEEVKKAAPQERPHSAERGKS